MATTRIYSPCLCLDTQVPYILLTLSKVAKTLIGLLIESAQTSMLPCDPEKMDSGRKGDAWTKK